MKDEFIMTVLLKAMEFVTVEQANQLKGLLEEQLYNIELTPKTTALVPVNNLTEKIALFLATKKLDGLSLKTLKNYHLHLTRFSRYLQKNFEDVNTMDLRVYLAAYSKTGVKNSTLATQVSYLKTFFQWLETEDYIAKSPTRKINTPKVEKKLRKALSLEEVEMLRCACETLREKALLEFFYSTGCRLDEVVKLNKDSINWQDGSVVVYGKGNKERKVYLNAKAKIHLWKYLESRTDTNEALFVTSKSPNSRLGNRSIEVDFSELGKKAGLKQRMFPHLIRHTTATVMLANGASLMEVQMLLGHDDPSTTMTYIDADAQNIKQSHKKHLS